MIERYKTFTLTLLVTLPCWAVFITLTAKPGPDALTIYQKWDSDNWTTVIGSNANPAAVILPVADGLRSLYVDLYRNDADNGRSMIYTPLGRAAIVPGTAAGEVTPFWLEFDFRFKGGTENACVFAGLFNADGDNDGSPAMNWLGVQLSGSGVSGRKYSSSGASSSDMLIGGGTDVMQRLKMHVYNSGGKTLMDIDLYTIDGETSGLAHIASVSGYVALDAGESFPEGLDVLGVRNTYYAAGDPPAHARLDMDNIYFSTEAPNSNSSAPSFAPVFEIPPPGVVIDTSPDSQPLKYIGSPSIVILPDGSYLASHDWFGSYYNEPQCTTVFRSTDRGASWNRIAVVTNQHFATLFCCAGSVYLIGTSLNYTPHSVIINRSVDGGVSWTAPVSPTTGRLLTSSGGQSFGCAPTPVIEAGGRIWRGFTEQFDSDAAKHTDTRIFFMSAPATSNLLDAASWVRSNGILFNPSWINADVPGWLEPNPVEYPPGSGKVISISRLDSWQSRTGGFELTGGAAGIPRYEVATLIHVVNPTNMMFLPNDTNSWLHMPGPLSKFTIRYDAESGLYWSVVNYISSQHTDRNWTYLPIHQRNILQLICSADLQTWTERAKVIRWKDGTAVANTEKTGFQYPDWQFDGDDLVCVVRTSWNGRSYHDSNAITFHRIKNFRNLAIQNSVPDRGACVFSATSIASDDGCIVESSETSGAGGSIVSTNSSSTALRTGDYGSGSQVKTILSFDTSGLPDHAIITSANIKLCLGSGSGSVENLGECRVDIKGGAGFSGATALENADFESPADAEQVAVVSVPLNQGDRAAVSITAEGLRWINKTGKTQFRLAYETGDNDNSTADYIGWYSGESAVDCQPVLEMTYEFMSVFKSAASEDGYIVESAEASGEGGTSFDSPDLQAGDTGGNCQIKSILSFDTSPLPDDAVITSAKLKLTRRMLRGTNPFTTHGTCYVDIRGGAGFSESVRLEAADFQAVASKVKIGLLSNATTGSGTAEADIDNSALESINKTGTTQFRIYFPSGSGGDNDADILYWYSGDAPADNNKPELHITYYR